MTDQFVALAALSDEERLQSLRVIVEEVYRLPEHYLRRMTHSRLQAWLAMSEPDARKVAEAYERLFAETPADMAMKRVMVVRSVVADMRPEEQQGVRALVPSVFEPPLGSSAGAEVAAEESGTGPRPWWAFWRR
jgi:hypothetical protein